MKPGDTGIRRILRAFTYSWDGFKAACKTEAAVRQELALCAVLLVVAFILPVAYVERILLISSLFLILLMEFINSAIEAVVDRVSPDRHELSKKAKDIGSLIVLVAFIHAFIVWGIIILELF